MRHLKQINNIKEKNQDEQRDKNPQLTLEDMEQKKIFKI